jgi:hypothetical protein
MLDIREVQVPTEGLISNATTPRVTSAMSASASSMIHVTCLKNHVIRLHI